MAHRAYTRRGGLEISFARATSLPGDDVISRIDNPDNLESNPVQPLPSRARIKRPVSRQSGCLRGLAISRGKIAAHK